MKPFTFVLIPGAGGDAWYWHLVAPVLHKAGYHAVAVALPAADDRAGLAEYAAATVRAIGEHDPKRRLGLDVDEMAGGHLVAFSRPAELAARLNAYLSALR